MNGFNEFLGKLENLSKADRKKLKEKKGFQKFLERVGKEKNENQQSTK